MKLVIDVPKEIAKALDSKTRREILKLLEERGSMTISDIARELNLSKSTVHHHLQELRKAGLVDVIKEDRETPLPKRYYGLVRRLVRVSKPKLEDASEYVIKALERGEDLRTSMFLAIAAAYRAVLESLGIDASEVLYELGKEIGKRLAELGSEETVLRKGLEIIAESVEFRQENDRVVVEIEGCHECSDLPYGPACHLEAGIIAGVLSNLRERPYEVREVECCGEGADRCVFVAEPATDEERPKS
ncbi:V4R domain-containing protein [Methanopyrus kandleri]|uniref:Predicted transcriptional regulator consisting of a V4R domain and a DNA-binding HTH domain n=2 Tax=Methanopyrus kandleri TaxID=2320 RepID=Q8TXW7_METKA|nr:V4R domain-containing protein [Methanopyrus kandleri]AAM01757.1 Predicted transcriptional regulator consisting of a V4R domain and a DNA-binding HTH domain [Methanopyrus kandleri AV19]HII70297.1 helix-turn-helix domain-containing protein [Methanopyrus kandleri]